MQYDDATAMAYALVREHGTPAYVQKLVKDDGQERVLYARQNQRGETKLAYCLKARYDAGLKDKGFLGVVHIYG